jgi:hypothetical protein
MGWQYLYDHEYQSYADSRTCPCHGKPFLLIVLLPLLMTSHTPATIFLLAQNDSINPLDIEPNFYMLYQQNKWAQAAFIVIQKIAQQASNIDTVVELNLHHLIYQHKCQAMAMA